MGGVTVNILLIEDAPAKAKECISYVKSIGLVCKWVSTEKEAKKIIKSGESFDLILLDMELVTSPIFGASQERHSGIRLLNCMKICGIDTPVILVTAYWDVVDMKYQEHGSDIHCFCNEKYFCNLDNWKRNDDDKRNNNSPKREVRFLEDLHLYLCHRYKNYAGAVEYSKINSIWKRNLGKLIERCLGGSTNEYFTFRE